MIRHMPTLGEQMKARREQLALSQNRAAKLANASRTTWINWETDRTVPERFNYVRIESVLGWETGSVQAAREGRDPVVKRTERSRADDVPLMLDELGIDLRKWRRVPQSTRDAVTTAYRIDRERRSKEAERADGA